jgi:hypothetical protein
MSPSDRIFAYQHIRHHFLDISHEKRANDRMIASLHYYGMID